MKRFLRLLDRGSFATFCFGIAAFLVAAIFMSETGMRWAGALTAASFVAGGYTHYMFKIHGDKNE